ncbi:hypothetical protein [Burkholderia arboris]|uniref:hypothetical protein n=1 Tax=Burkholderia arboris TaxID=488730 RepID=UPI001CF56A18|nr:hypothetical protein [Burkholderia arboris]MCA8047515.1 hypothetical protein [Burkholderia arboris]
MVDLTTEQEKEFEERKRLYERHRDDLSKRQISNAENLDKSILTYSGTGLALSLGFLKDFIPIAKAEIAWALYASWVFFTLAMVLVVISYVVSLKVIGLQLDRAERYYLSSNEDALTERGKWDSTADHMNNWMSAAAFVLAIVLTILFVSANLKGATMSDKKVSPTIAQDGISGMQMQKVTPPAPTVQKGITGGPMQPASSGQPSSPSSQQPQSQPQQGGNSSQTKP